MGGSSAPAPAPYGYDAQGNPVSKAERDAWNARLAASGRTSQQEYDYQIQQQQQNQYLNMFAGAGGHAPSGGHSPSGPTREEIDEQNRITTGQNDLDKAYGNYLEASGSATEYINQQISDQRTNAALLGVDFNITDQQKSDRISNYFASIYNETDFTQLTDLNEEFGDPDLIQRGVAVDPGEDESNPVTESGGVQGTRQGGTLSAGLLEEDPLASASSILGGG